MSDNRMDRKRRRLLTSVTSGVGAVGVVGAAIPFVSSMSPSARAKAAGAPVEVDFSKLEPGHMLTEVWRGKPVWILHRTKEMLGTLPKLDDTVADPHSEQPQQPPYCKNEDRSIKPEIWVAIGICTHLGCVPNPVFTQGIASGVNANWLGGFFCPCHGSMYDLAGRVFKNVPAPLNLVIPPHKYLSDTRIVVGVDTESKGGASS